MKLHPKDSPAFALPRHLKPKAKRRPRATVPEAVTQDLVEQYLDALGIPYLHIPAFLLNAAFSMRGSVPGNVLGAMRNAAQAVRGFPDIVAFDAKSQRFLPLELKTEIGKLTANQETWKAWLGTKVCRSFEEAKMEIDTWRGIPIEKVLEKLESKQ